MLRADVSLLLMWDQSWPLVLSHTLHRRALWSKATSLHTGGFRTDVWKKGGERWAGTGRSNTKRNQMESTGKTEDVLAGRVETSRLDGIIDS